MSLTEKSNVHLPLWKVKHVALQLCSASVAWIMEVRAKNPAITFRFILASNIHDGIWIWSCMGTRYVVFHMATYGRSTLLGDTQESLQWGSVWHNDGSVSLVA